MNIDRREQARPETPPEIPISEEPLVPEHRSEEEALPTQLSKKENSSFTLTPSQKHFRTFLGAIVLFLMVGGMIFSMNTASGTLDASLIQKGSSPGIKPGATFSTSKIYAPQKNYTVTIQNGGDIQLSVWDYLGSNGNYVQVFVDGKALTNAFMISDKAVKVSVPSKGLIQVRGISSPNNGTISYALFFNKTGETYFNMVPLSGENTYTLKTAV